MAGLIVLPTHSPVGLVCLVKEDRELNPNTSDSWLLYRDRLRVRRRSLKREVEPMKARLGPWKRHHSFSEYAHTVRAPMPLHKYPRPVVRPRKPLEGFNIVILVERMCVLSLFVQKMLSLAASTVHPAFALLLQANGSISEFPSIILTHGCLAHKTDALQRPYSVRYP